MKRRKFAQIAAGTPLAVWLSGNGIQGCRHADSESTPLEDEELVQVPSQFRAFQFYAPFAHNDLKKMGFEPTAWQKKRVRLDYEVIREITTRVSEQERDGAKHPARIDVLSLLESEDGLFEISPYLNHSNPNSHITMFGKQDLADLMAGKNVHLATGFHQNNHFHMLMIKPSFELGERISVKKSLLRDQTEDAVDS